MKKRLILTQILIVLALIISSCEVYDDKDLCPRCDLSNMNNNNNCQLNDSHFIVTAFPAPTDTLNCDAFFESWFINTTNTCVKVGYSACEKIGFTTEAECANCIGSFHNVTAN